MDIHISSLGDETVGPLGDYVKAAAHWRNVAEIEQVSIGRTPSSSDGRADSVQPWLTTTNGATSLTPSLRRAGAGRAGRLVTVLVKVNGKRPVKIEAQLSQRSERPGRLVK